jgi:sporulation protein YlmC with PRC-barrel domain
LSNQFVLLLREQNPAIGVIFLVAVPPSMQENMMNTHSAVASPPSGAVQFTTKLPGDTAAVSTYYKRNVYDAADGKIGDVTDLIMGPDGKISTAVISVGGFLGVGEKEVAVPFGSLHVKKKDNSWYLVMHTTKEALTNAPKFAYSGERARW